MESVLPADCLSIQEIGTAAGVFMIITWVILLVTALFMCFKALQVEQGAKKYFYLNAFICAVAVWSYFAMFSGMGWETIMGCRQLFYVRYIDWAASTALILLSLGLVAGQDMATIAAVMGVDVGMILAGYLGAVATIPTVRWLWFLLGLVLYAIVFFVVMREYRQTVIDRDDVGRIELYTRVSVLVLVVWTMYPLVWMLAEGSGAFGVSLEVIFYCILDLLSKVVYAFMVANYSGPYHSEEPGKYSYSERVVSYERQYV